MLNENWRPRFVLCIVWVQMGYFPQPQCIKFTINIFFEQREPRIIPQTETRVVKFWLNETSYNVTRCSNPNACPHFP